jgi:putative YphP/YqiW family bacilliredoxin
MYPEEMVKPMQAELTAAGFQDLHSAEAVENAMKLEGTTLVVVNSVCGCAARNQEQNEFRGKKPDHLITVLQELKDAVDAARQHMFPFSIIAKYGFVQNGLVHMLERHHIEGRPAELIAENLKDAFNEIANFQSINKTTFRNKVSKSLLI